MGEVRPGVFVVAVVLADRPPLALAQVRPPGPPRDTRPGLLQPPLLSRQGDWVGQRGALIPVGHGPIVAAGPAVSARAPRPARRRAASWRCSRRRAPPTAS